MSRSPHPRRRGRALVFCAALGASSYLAVTASHAPAATADAAAPATGPSRTPTRVHEGDLDITKAGTVVSGLDVHGFIRVRADNVVIRDVIVRGRSVSDSTGRALIKNTAGAKNLLIEHTLLSDDHPNVNTTAGILGRDFTARHVEVRGAVDSVQIHGGTATVTDSLLHDPVSYTHDPLQGGGPSHNDGVQILGGHDIVLRNNIISGAPNFGILAAPQKGAVTNLQVSGNRVSNGYCALRFSPYGGFGLTASVTDNRVTPNQTSPHHCGINVARGTGVTTSGNRWTDGSDITTTVTDH